MNYYDEIIEKLDNLIKNKEYSEASFIIKQELSMPYVSKDFEEKLNNYLNIINYDKKDDSNEKKLSDEEIQEYLFKDPKSQLLAVSSLCEKNLRDYESLIQEYFNHKPYLNAQVILIDALVRQELSSEFKIDYYGMDVTFIPRYVEFFEESDGFIEANKLLEQYLGNDFPSELLMAKECLVNECFLNMPMNFTSEEGVLLAQSICYYVLNLMDESQAKRFIENNHIKYEYLMNLRGINIDI